MEVDVASNADKGGAGASAPLSAGEGAVQDLLASGSQTSVTLALHPLVVMNISDHWTRIKAQNNGQQKQVIGALLGKQAGRHLELMNSFELRYDVFDGVHLTLDKEFFQTRYAQYAEVFSALEFLGWYTTGADSPSESDQHLHQQICDLNESPVLLKLNPGARHQDKLPLSAFESVIDIVDGQMKLFFIPLRFTLATEEAERIGVDHVARVSRVSGQEHSPAAEQLLAQQNAIKMLYSRVQLLVQYLQAVAEQRLPRNEAILREISSLCCRLPVFPADSFHDEFYQQCCDVALMSYLGALTKSCSSINQLVNKFNLLHDASSARHGISTKRSKGMFL